MEAADTIVAVSTPAGASPRGIVRLSGPDAFDLAGRLLAGARGRFAPRNNYVAVEAECAIADMRFPARLYCMRAPTSYTREDVAELHTFGSPVLLALIVDRLTALGARAAGPGEFTRRAFLNGRLDLVQAEAVGRLIHARSAGEFRAAAGTLRGRVSLRLQGIREGLADLAALTELSLDFGDQDVTIISGAEVADRLSPICDDLRRLREQRGASPPGQNVRAVLFGPPNAGKSSLFNALVQSERTIVSPHPGTTRDTVEAVVQSEDMDVLLADTAGLRPPGDEVEDAAVARSREAACRADLGLCVIEGHLQPSEDALAALRTCQPDRTLVLLNKCDLGPCPLALHEALPSGVPVLRMSAREGTGVAELLRRIRRRVADGQVDHGPDELMTTARQAALLRRAVEALTRAGEAVAGGQPMDLVAADLREALGCLAGLTGETLDGEAAPVAAVTDDVLDRIFSSFCIGK